MTLKLPFDLNYGVDEYGEAGYDMIALDRYSVTYPRRFVARNGRLSFTAAGAAFTVTGLPSNQVSGLPHRQQWREPAHRGEGERFRDQLQRQLPGYHHGRHLPCGERECARDAGHRGGDRAR